MRTNLHAQEGEASAARSGSGARQVGRRSPPADRGAPVPLALACLVGRVGPERLLEAAQASARLGVAPEQWLLAEGWLSEEDYYAALARWLGLPFVGEAFPPGPGVAYPGSVVANLVPGEGWPTAPVWTLAPSGRRIAELAALRARGTLPRDRFAIASPSTIRESVMKACAGGIAQAASGELSGGDSAASASGPLGPWQACALGGLAAGGLAGAAFGGFAFVALSILFSVVFAGAVGLRLMACAASLAPLRRFPALADFELPTYTIVVALYREAEVAEKLVAALDAIDYPRARLEIKLVVEEEDLETCALLKALRLPARYEVLVAPDGRPRTKPRALNVALAQARGERLVVYDAEDEPAPDQLRRAAAAFAGLPRSVSCLQARLAIDNVDDSALSSLFAIEYAALFSVLNPGLAALYAPMALGGTSNHFRTEALRAVGGWDAWNVTEDIDLGFRLARHGYHVEQLDSDTWEEAPARLGLWMRQRRRWFKGWMQTGVVHSRSPSRLLAELGAWRATCAALLLLGALLGPMFGPAFAVVTIVAGVRGDLLAPEGLVAVTASTLWCSVWLTGSVTSIWPIVLGLKRRRLLRLMLFAPLLPIYGLLLSVAAWWALVDLLRDPFHWAKTQHGLARTSRLRGRAARPPATFRG